MTEKYNDIKRAVESLHSCSAAYRESIQVSEKHEEETAWEGVVHVFNVAGHPQADTCYAWSSAVEGSKKLRFYAVLKIPPVDSPEAAVRAAIVADHKAGRSP